MSFTDAERFIVQALADRVFTSSEDVTSKAVHGLLANPSTGWSFANGEPVAPPPPVNPDAPVPLPDPQVAALQSQLDAANAALATANAAAAQEELNEPGNFAGTATTTDPATGQPV